MVEKSIFSGESKNIEYKVTLPDKSEKYMKTIVAFANTQGGKLIVGIDDKTHEIVVWQTKYYLKSKGKENGTYIRVAGTSRQKRLENLKWRVPEFLGMNLLV